MPETTVRARDPRQMSPVLRIALLLGVLVHLAGFLVFRVSSNQLPASVEAPPFILFVSSDEGGEEVELLEQASLFDSAPLFVPGEWSSASGVFPTEFVQEWEVFPEFEPNIQLLSEVRPTRLSLPRVADVQRPSDLLDIRFWDLFKYFGQEDKSFVPPEVWTSVAVVTVLSGNEEFPEGSTVNLNANLAYADSGLRPLICYLNMSAPGIVMGAPIVEQSTGTEALDEEILEWLALPATLANLPAGFLELRIYP
ncbi:MAG: hypothetical protein ACPGSB_01340 [Opitutales bacterium]